MSTNRRIERIERQMQKEVGNIFVKDINNEDIGLVTCTGVKMSKDLKHARILYTVYGDKAQKDRTAEILNNKVSFIRYLIGQRIRMRNTPEIFIDYKWFM